MLNSVEARNLTARNIFWNCDYISKIILKIILNNGGNLRNIYILLF